MGIDYDVKIGLGKQIKIENHIMFSYYLLDEFKENYPEFTFCLTSQEYKDSICYTSLFVGKILFTTDPRDGDSIDQTEFLGKLNSENFTLNELDKLCQVCNEIKNGLKLEENFSKYGINLLITTF